MCGERKILPKINFLLIFYSAFPACIPFYRLTIHAEVCLAEGMHE